MKMLIEEEFLVVENLLQVARDKMLQP